MDGERSTMSGKRRIFWRVTSFRLRFSRTEGEGEGGFPRVEKYPRFFLIARSANYIRELSIPQAVYKRYNSRIPVNGTASTPNGFDSFLFVDRAILRRFN